MSEINNLPYDLVLIDIADYVDAYVISNPAALEIARYCLIDSMACALDALEHAVCMRLVGPPAPVLTVAVLVCLQNGNYLIAGMAAALLSA